MANEQRTGAADQNNARRREYEIDRITALYVEEYRAGRSPRVEEYARRYPEYATDIRDFVADYLLFGAHVPEPDALPAASLSPAALAVLARIETEESQEAPTPDVSLVGLVRRGIELGLAPPRLAAAVGLPLDVLAKLDARAIAANSVPRTLGERLAEKLQATPAAVAAFLGGSVPSQAPSFFYADEPPEQRQETFLEAIEASGGMDDQAKREWAAIVAHDVPTT